jgi:hypothetical protein
MMNGVYVSRMQASITSFSELNPIIHLVLKTVPIPGTTETVDQPDLKKTARDGGIPLEDVKAKWAETIHGGHGANIQALGASIKKAEYMC